MDCQEEDRDAGSARMAPATGWKSALMENTRGNWAFEKSPQSTTSMARPMPRNLAS